MKPLNIVIPERLIAEHPSKERDQCRLLCLNRDSGKIQHLVFTDLLGFFRRGDLLIFNDTKVVNARLFGTKKSGGAVELLLLNKYKDNLWKSLLRGKNIKEGTELRIDSTDFDVVVNSVDKGSYIIAFPDHVDVLDLMDRLGQIPLPPYIKREPEFADYSMYQTVFAKEKGSVAAPTASLHFTDDMITRIKEMGVLVEFLTLHVGYGTFSPVRDPDTHIMHEEYFSFDSSLGDKILSCRHSGGKVWAVGTTVVRTLESAFNDGLELLKSSGSTKLFIRPPYQFKVVDCMVTNFHHPSTSLIYLVSAFAGEENIERAYNEAIGLDYRMLSYGDAMAIIR